MSKNTLDDNLGFNLGRVNPITAYRLLIVPRVGTLNTFRLKRLDVTQLEQTSISSHYSWKEVLSYLLLEY